MFEYRLNIIVVTFECPTTILLQLQESIRAYHFVLINSYLLLVLHSLILVNIAPVNTEQTSWRKP